MCPSITYSVADCGYGVKRQAVVPHRATIVPENQAERLLVEKKMNRNSLNAKDFLVDCNDTGVQVPLNNPVQLLSSLLAAIADHALATDIPMAFREVGIYAIDAIATSFGMTTTQLGAAFCDEYKVAPPEFLQLRLGGMAG